MKKALLVTCLVLAGCDSNKLSDVEKASKQVATCKVNQIMPNECSKFDEALEIAELKATQAGIEHERIYASRQIGEKVVSGNINDSPYQRVKRSLESKPFYIDAIEENFILLSTNDVRSRNSCTFARRTFWQAAGRLQAALSSFQHLIHPAGLNRPLSRSPQRYSPTYGLVRCLV